MNPPSRSHTTLTLVAMIVFTLMLGVIDLASGCELQFFVFYFMPVAMLAWSCKGVQPYALAVLCALITLGEELFVRNPVAPLPYALWNTVIRLVSFLVVAYTVTRIRALLEQSHQLSEELKQALSEVKTLTGLLPICSSCKKIRTDQGYWQQIEVYVSAHSEARFTHGYCQDCAAKALREAGLDVELARLQLTVAPGVPPKTT